MLAGMHLDRFSDARDFVESATPFLVEREAEHNLIFGVAATLREDPGQYTGAPYMAAVSDGDRVVAAAIQTPPWRLVLSEIDDDRAIGVLVDDLLARDLPGVQGPPEVARAFVDAWVARAGQPAHHELAERIYRLTAVRPLPPVAGFVRPARPADRALVIDWVGAFMREAHGEDDPAADEAAADRWIAGRSRVLHLWQVEGDTVSLCGVGGPTPNGIRIGPVYTPPDRRGRGYASALVAAVSQAELDAGRRFCFLFTDLANPTSNRIYQAIGYEPVRDIAVYGFDPR